MCIQWSQIVHIGRIVDSYLIKAVLVLLKICGQIKEHDAHIHYRSFWVSMKAHITSSNIKTHKIFSKLYLLPKAKQLLPAACWQTACNYGNLYSQKEVCLYPERIKMQHELFRGHVELLKAINMETRCFQRGRRSANNFSTNKKRHVFESWKSNEQKRLITNVFFKNY